MATFIELDTLTKDLDLLSKIRTALRGEASNVVESWLSDATSVSATKLVWARQVLLDAKFDAIRCCGIILWDNKTLSVAELQSLSEAVVSSEVQGLIEYLVAARAAA